MASKEEIESDSLMWQMVRTIAPKVDDWTEEGKLKRKWNVYGQIQNVSNSHGLCYEIRHDDGTYAWYDCTEFEIVTTDNKWQKLPCGISGYDMTALEYGSMIKNYVNQGKLNLAFHYLEAAQKVNMLYRIEFAIENQQL